MKAKKPRLKILRNLIASSRDSWRLLCSLIWYTTLGMWNVLSCWKSLWTTKKFRMILFSRSRLLLFVSFLMILLLDLLILVNSGSSFLQPMLATKEHVNEKLDSAHRDSLLASLNFCITRIFTLIQFSFLATNYSLLAAENVHESMQNYPEFVIQEKNFLSIYNAFFKYNVSLNDLSRRLNPTFTLIQISRNQNWINWDYRAWKAYVIYKKFVQNFWVSFSHQKLGLLSTSRTRSHTKLWNFRWWDCSARFKGWIQISVFWISKRKSLCIATCFLLIKCWLFRSLISSRSVEEISGSLLSSISASTRKKHLSWREW